MRKRVLHSIICAMDCPIDLTSVSLQMPRSKMARHFAVRSLLNAAGVLDTKQQFEKVRGPHWEICR